MGTPRRPLVFTRMPRSILTVESLFGTKARAEELGATIVLPPHRNPPEGQGNGPGHRELWVRDPDGYTVVVASPDGEAFEPA